MLSFTLCKNILWTNCIDIFNHAYQFMYNNLTEILCFLLTTLVLATSLIHGKITYNSKV